MIQRLLLAAIAFFPFLSLSADSAKWEIHSRYEKAETFKDITEYFGGKESYLRKIVFRTQEDRAGYYWVIHRSSKRLSLPEGGKFVLEYFPTGSGTAIKHEYPITEFSNKRTVYLGVTGTDWKRSRTPLAWKIQLLDAKGKLLNSKQSFLWSYPES